MMYAALCKPPPLHAWGNASISVTVLAINKAVNMIILLSCEQEKTLQISAFFLQVSVFSWYFSVVYAK